MAAFAPYQLVRVVKLHASPEHYDGWRTNERAPRVGDVGTLVDVLEAPGLSPRYVVECSSPAGDGSCVWLSDFDEEELAPVAGEGG